MTDACRAAKTCATMADMLPGLGDGGPVIVKLAVIMPLMVLFAALVLACAVWIASALLRRDPWLGLRSRQPQPDPLSEVHGDVPRLDFLSATAPPRNRPATGAAKAGGRVIPSDAPAGHVRQGGER